MSKFAPTPEKEFVFVLNDVARLFKTYADQRVSELGMTRAQWAVLSRLERCEGVSQAELATALDLAPISLARLVDKLCDQELVERRSAENDRRAYRLYLAPGAEPVLKRLAALSHDVLGICLAGVSSDELAHMTAQLGLIKANLKTVLQEEVLV
jgi:MarR family transcriptional regulator, transcriptional regulator for hemolysin